MNESFLSAIIASPDDDMPRLVFADWLEEHGEAPRAEFIRVQIENHHRPSPELARRSDDLLARHRDQWIIPGISGVQTFRRGFVEGLRMAAADFLANAERIGRAAPVVELRLPIAIDHFAELAAVPWLNRIQHLDLTGNVGLGSRLEDFFGATALPRLQNLELRNCQLWPEHLGTLARFAAHWPQLRRLNLSGNPVGNEGMAHLSEGVAFKNLQELIIRCDEQQQIDAINTEGVHLLSQPPKWNNLQRIDLTGHYINDQGMIMLSLSDDDYPHLIEIDLTDNEIGPLTQVASQDMQNPDHKLTNLRRLILDGNRFDYTFLHYLLNWKQLSVMEFISLRNLGEPLDEPSRELIRQSPWQMKIIIDNEE